MKMAAGDFKDLRPLHLNSKENDPSSVNYPAPSQMKWPVCESEPSPPSHHHIPSGHALTSMGGKEASAGCFVS